MKPADAKLQRWIDLIAALLRHRYGATLAELKTIVPGYGGDRTQPTIDRMFERDKDDFALLDFPSAFASRIRTKVKSERYYIKASEMYLPYLAFAARGSGSSTPRVPPSGYRSVPTITFEPESSRCLSTPRARRRRLVLRRSRATPRRRFKSSPTTSARRSGRLPESPTTTPRASEPHAAPNVSLLGEALLRRKQVSFVYRSMNRDVTDARTVEPYGLFFSGGHWYLAGRDAQSGAVRSFRVSRMERIAANDKKPQSADYEIPNSFRLAAHARTKQSWELGDDAPEEMIVEIRGDSGASLAARTLGAAVDDAPNHRRFRVRRVDSFVRWIMSFAGEVVPISPPSLVRAVPCCDWCDGGAVWQISHSPPRMTTDARERLERVLRALPLIIQRESVPIAEMEAAAGVDALTLLDDLRVLTERDDEPGGFVEAVSILFDADSVSVRSPHFARPTRITLPELLRARARPRHTRRVVRRRGTRHRRTRTDARSRGDRRDARVRSARGPLVRERTRAVE